MMWQSHDLKVADGLLGWDEAGSGDPLLFLAGGPGDAVEYLRPVAELLTSDYRCILLDQRGCGNSPLARLDEETLALERLYEDIETVRMALGVEQITVIGHSWGAELALYYAMHYPQRIKRAILIGIGPLDAEGSAVAAANSLKPLTMAERDEVERLDGLRKRAQVQEDWDLAKQYHIASAKLLFRAWFFDPAIAEEFGEAWERSYTVNPVVHRVVNAYSKEVQVWGNVGQINAPVLIIYGYQDFEPLTQAYRLKEEMPNVTVRLVNKAGHMIWLEQPEWLEREMREFLTH
jgi:proline iminopeptidase